MAKKKLPAALRAHQFKPGGGRVGASKSSKTTSVRTIRKTGGKKGGKK